jgi:toxin secretion/phage lysis holin
MRILNIPMEQFINQVKTFLYGIILYLQIDAEIARVLIYMIFLDMILGSVKAVLVPEMKFSLQTFWQGLIKKCVLLIIVMVLALTALGLGFADFREMVSTVMKIMIVNEAISAFNSIRSIYAKKEHKSSDFISILIEKIEGFLTKKMNQLINLFEK